MGVHLKKCKEPIILVDVGAEAHRQKAGVNISVASHAFVQRFRNFAALFNKSTRPGKDFTARYRDRSRRILENGRSRSLQRRAFLEVLG
jgi:hypothetical protein